MHSRRREGLALLVSLVVLALALGLLTRLLTLKRHDMGSTWGHFLQEEEHSIDLLFLGSSLVYCDVVPAVIWEETGLTLTSWQFRGIVTFINNQDEAEYMHLFTADHWEGELTPCDEGDLQWVPKAEVPALNLWPGDRIFLSLIARDTPFFSLKLTYHNDNLVEAVLNGTPLTLA